MDISHWERGVLIGIRAEKDRTASFWNTYPSAILVNWQSYLMLAGGAALFFWSGHYSLGLLLLGACVGRLMRDGEIAIQNATLWNVLRQLYDWQKIDEAISMSPQPRPWQWLPAIVIHIPFVIAGVVALLLFHCSCKV